VVGVFIISGVPAMGVLLCWLGVRTRSKPKIAVAPASASHIDTPELATVTSPQQSNDDLVVETSRVAETPSSPCAAAAPSSVAVATLTPPADFDQSLHYENGPEPSDIPSNGEFDSSALAGDGQETFQIGSTGQLIGKCGPKMSGQAHYHLIGGLVIVVGIAVMIGLNVAPGAADPATAGKIGLALGGGLILFGGAMIALQLTRAPQVIWLYDDRLEEESGSKRRTIPLEQIFGLRLQEFYEHRLAPQTFLATVRINGQRDLKFSTALGDDADLIVRCLADIAADVEVREFMG
jgi:hypothetical protein